MKWLIFLSFVAACSAQLSFFNVVKFPNTRCMGDNGRNGTCLTNNECSDRNGIESGTCAEGYGVCCIITLQCGESSNENNTYMTLASTSKPSVTRCTYGICRLNKDICRIKLDFIDFQIAGPATTTEIALGTNGGALGDCITDTFSVSGSNGFGSPVICGFNTNQHMFLDASDGCSQVNFHFGGDSTTRRYDIRVIQYECGDTQGGPTGCLQYFTGTSGTVASYNFPTTDTTITSGTTHLSSQYYTACWRRETGICALCFLPVVTIATVANNLATAQSSFGISPSPAATIGQVGGDQARCVPGDYIGIPYATTAAIATTQTTAKAFVYSTAVFRDRNCGRVLGPTKGDDTNDVYNTNISTCTFSRPFRVRVNFDEDELAAAGGTAITDETKAFPQGTLGFNLRWGQQKCA